MVVRNAASSLILAIFMYPMSQDLGWSRTLLVGAASFGALASSLIAPFIGWCVDRFGARPVLTICVFLLGLSTFLTGWATIPLVFYITFGFARILFNSPIQLTSTVVVSRWFIKWRGRANGILFFCHSVGMTAFPLLASIIIAIYGWQMAWHLLGVIVWFVSLIPVYVLIAETPESISLNPDGQKNIEEDEFENDVPLKEETYWTLSEAINTSTLWKLAIAAGLFYVIHGGINVHMAAYFQDIGLSSTRAAIGVSLNAVFTGIGGLIFGWLIERMREKICYMIIAFIMGTSSLLFVSINNFTQAWIYASIFGVALGGMLVVPPVAIANYFGRKSLGQIRGFTEIFVSLGQAIGGIVSGVIFDYRNNYDIAFFVLAVVSIMAFIIVATSSKPKKSSTN
ncbi:MAG: MFS transporter [Dehalococcoidia bacterium]